MTYRRYYWPTIQGRGEFVRLALEDAGLDYLDVARGDEADGQGVKAMMALMQDGPRPAFAPPFLQTDDLIVGQTANILLYLGGRHRLAPDDEAGRLWTHQLQLTVADLAAEAHDTHHPLGGDLYYEDQKEEAKRRAEGFRTTRIPKYLGWFETVLARNSAGGGWLVGSEPTYADLSLFQAVAGLRYAFTAAMRRIEADVPRVTALHDQVAARPRIAAYLASDRRIPFNTDGVFRHYEDLDR